MGDDSFIGILIFGAIAVFLGHRLWQVLGRRDGDGPQAGPALTGPMMAPIDRTPAQPQKPPIANPSDPLSLEGSLKQIKLADPSFDEKSFVAGASAAFTMIVTAFARGDRDALKPLLSDIVYASFDQAIRTREEAGQTQEISVVRISSSIENAALTGDTAQIVVAFRSGQTNVIRGNDGTIVEGDTKRIEDVTDIWSFRRDVKSRDPNWILVETRHQS